MSTQEHGLIVARDDEQLAAEVTVRVFADPSSGLDEVGLEELRDRLVTALCEDAEDLTTEWDGSGLRVAWVVQP